MCPLLLAAVCLHPARPLAASRVTIVVRPLALFLHVKLLTTMLRCTLVKPLLVLVRGGHLGGGGAPAAALSRGSPTGAEQEARRTGGRGRRCPLIAVGRRRAVGARVKLALDTLQPPLDFGQTI